MSQYQQYPPQQPQQFQPLPPKKKHTGLKVAGGIIGGFILLAALGAALGDDPAPAKKPSTTVEAKPTQDEIDETIEEGDKAADALDKELDDIQKDNEKGRKKLKDKADREAAKDGQYGDGDYIVGQDIPAGTYESAGASSDVFDVCAITTEPSGETTMPQIKSGNKNERIIITLAAEDGTVSVQGCEPLTKR
ncbi:hypothetical protein [Streptomyces iconiensis]|uniref:Uncharacterized protein n=1 Tax=Streptomyces iconiensis TaxID=1384038 RepID=A0ABT7A9B9_9ACTN|nr:hypothetical protein [Streptomyces iconiensis]MDJ1137947.1 hypothetical protein [Streptomyces iconiensis]